MNPTILVDLRNVLAKLYESELSIRRIIADAGLDSRKMVFVGRAIDDWHSVLTEAEKVDRVESLLQVVESEYSNNPEFQEACQAYRQAQGKQETVNLPSSVPTHQPKTSPKPWLQRLPALLMGILLLGFAGGGAYWVWGGSLSSGTIKPIATVTVPASAASEEKSAEGSSTSVALPIATPAAVLPSPTSITIVATISPPASTPPEIAKIYPCEAETSFLSNIRLIGLRSAPTGRVDRFVPGGVTVLVMGKHQGENLYDIWYSEENIRGWISPENLILPDSCPK